MSFQINYTASPTASAFHDSDEFIRAVLGPVGAGKTVICILEILYQAIRQEAGRDNVRRTRTIVIRQSYPQLISTVIKTFEDWLGPVGKMTFGTPIVWRAKFPLDDGTSVEMEVMFMALERADDASKLRSLEVTNAMISEYAEIPEEILKMLRTRVGRYPAKKNGVEATRPCIWMESNPPNTRSHWYRLFEVTRPKGHVLFRQPAPLFYDPDTEEYTPNPLAENIENLPGGYEYYYNQIHGATRDFINVYVLGEYGATYSGQPIFQEYSDTEHCAPDVLRPIQKNALVCGIDFGLNAAVVITEQTSIGALHVLDEVCGEDIMLDAFLDDHLRPLLWQEYNGWPLLFIGDPSDNTGKAGYTLLRDRKWACQPAYTNDPIQRWDAVKWFLTRRGGFSLSPRCELLREGFLGSYHFKKTAKQMDAPHTGRADKGPTSHPHDALGYAAMHHRRHASKKHKPPTNRKPFLWA